LLYFQEGDFLMKTRAWLMILLSITLLIMLAACSKSASKAPVVIPTATSTSPFPTPLPNSAIDKALAGTQTAQALANPTLPSEQTAIMVLQDTETPAPVIIEQPSQTNTAAVVVLPTATRVPPTAIAVPTATPGRPATYTLQSGEFPFCIARRFNVSAADLLALNGMDLNSHPAAGTVLKIPQTGTWDSGPRALQDHPTVYTVKAGDTIYSIACAFGDVDPTAIAYANGLTSPYTLTAGEQINIP
jgi:LysM repeat protein